MHIGVARFAIYLPEAMSLKDKRHVVKSVVQRARNQFNAGIAEVADLDDPRVATIGVTVVSNSSGHADEMLQAVLGFFERNTTEGSIAEIETETIPF
jgi:uncharacterized protein YlxP (DUF503 family)